MVNGWFTKEMPDLNQDNPYVANFLIQHALWCVEEFGVDGWRIDTYIYLDQAFMNRCNQAMLNEYPKITMFGEVWVHGTANAAFFTRNRIDIQPRSNANSIADFQCLFSGILPTAKEPPNGVDQLYQTLSNDFLYEDPMTNVIFLDNHDLTRFFSEVEEDVSKLKMGIGWLLTERGIPQIYYGTEVRMKGIKNPDGWVRLDFPGGWPGDSKNAFTGMNLNGDESSVLGYTRKLGLFRKTSSAIRTGKMMQFIPENGLYVYFRYDQNQTILCAMNTNTGAKPIALSRFAERIDGYSKARDVISGDIRTLSDSLVVAGKTTLILELLRK